jgi:RND family efflux transporter MFP subunit
MQGKLFAAGLMVALAVSCSKPTTPQGTSARLTPRPVQLVAVEARLMERVIHVTGTLAAQERATVSVKVPGRIRNMAVDIGSVVGQGDVLAQVEPRDYELRVLQAVAALAQARAAVGLPLDGTDDRFEPEKASTARQTGALLLEATKNHQRIESLFKDGVLAKSELDAAESLHTVALNRHEAALEEARTRSAALAQRRTELDLARQQLSDSTVRAPFSGTVQARLVSPGEFLASGAPVLQLVQIDPLRLRLEVPEREASAIRSGQLVQLTVEGDTNTYQGTLVRISPALDERTRVLIVEADVPGHGALRPGLFARAHILIQKNDRSLSVPAGSLIVFAGIEKVVVVREGHAVEKSVTTGRREAGCVEILGGLNQGDMVVLNPGNLRSGQPVTVQTDTPAPVPERESERAAASESP